MHCTHRLRGALSHAVSLAKRMSNPLQCRSVLNPIRQVTSITHKGCEQPHCGLLPFPYPSCANFFQSAPRAEHEVPQCVHVLVSCPPAALTRLLQSLRGSKGVQVPAVATLRGVGCRHRDDFHAYPRHRRLQDCAQQAHRCGPPCSREPLFRDSRRIRFAGHCAQVKLLRNEETRVDYSCVGSGHLLPLGGVVM